MYYSTEHKSPLVNLSQAVTSSNAPDGGLYMPEKLPYVPAAFFRNIGEMSLKDIAYVVTDMLIGDELDQETVHHLINDSFTFDIPLIPTNNSKISSLELFHGPTFTSKDIGMRFMARLLSKLGAFAGNKTTGIIIAGSGNSGSAVADAFAEIPNTKITILYPKGTVPELQLAKIYSKPDKILAIEVRGSYDDCIALQRTALFDGAIGSNMKFAPANSMNIARIFPMVPVFFHLYARMLAHGAAPGSIVVSIPTGNLTALVAGIIAKKMGLPIKRFVAATNANNAVGRILKNNSQANVKTIKTISSELDISNPSNLSRIKELYNGNIDDFFRDVDIISLDDREIRLGMTETFLVDKYLADPHSALAYSALKKSLRTGETGVFLSTFHPALFNKIVEEQTGILPPSPLSAINLKVIPKHPLSVPPVYQVVKKIIQQYNT